MKLPHIGKPALLRHGLQGPSPWKNEDDAAVTREPQIGGGVGKRGQKCRYTTSERPLGFEEDTTRTHSGKGIADERQLYSGTHRALYTKKNGLSCEQESKIHQRANMKT
jgi:hypothetical protein